MFGIAPAGIVLGVSGEVSQGARNPIRHLAKCAEYPGIIRHGRTDGGRIQAGVQSGGILDPLDPGSRGDGALPGIARHRARGLIRKVARRLLILILIGQVIRPWHA